MNKEDIPWVVFNLKDNLFSISSRNVVAIIKEPNITRLPKTSDFIKGIFTYRNETFKLIDLRKVLSFKSISHECKEFSDLMDQRANDHKNWLLELENSVTEKRKFSLTTDPHKCAFGKWYDSYREQGNLSLRILRVLDQFDNPHRLIHKIAHQVEDLKTENKYEDAYDIIEKTREKELNSMLELFEKVKDQYKLSNQQISILMKVHNSKTALAVDSVNSVELLNDIDTSNTDNKFINPNNAKIFKGLAKTNDEKMVIKLYDEELILDNF